MLMLRSMSQVIVEFYSIRQWSAHLTNLEGKKWVSLGKKVELDVIPRDYELCF